MKTETQKQIGATIEAMKKWGMLKGFNDDDIELLTIHLKKIAGTAVMEANNRIQNILPDFYREITKP